MKSNALRTLLSAIFLLTLCQLSPAHAQVLPIPLEKTKTGGGKQPRVPPLKNGDGRGGGDIIKGYPVSSADIRKAVLESKPLVVSAAQYLEYMYQNHPDKAGDNATGVFYDLLTQVLRKLFPANQNEKLYSLIQKATFDFYENEPCWEITPDGKKREVAMSTTSAPESPICVSLKKSNEDNKLDTENYRRRLAALVFHEISHKMGTVDSEDPSILNSETGLIQYYANDHYMSLNLNNVIFSVKTKLQELESSEKILREAIAMVKTAPTEKSLCGITANAYASQLGTYHQLAGGTSENMGVIPATKLNYFEIALYKASSAQNFCTDLTIADKDGLLKWDTIAMADVFTSTVDGVPMPHEKQRKENLRQFGDAFFRNTLKLGKPAVIAELQDAHDAIAMVLEKMRMRWQPYLK